MMLSEPPKGGVELPFEAIREGWSVYKTKGDVLVKLKLILVKLFLIGVSEDGVAQLATGSNVIVASTVPPTMKGTPSKEQYTQERLVKEISEPDLAFETIREDWNDFKADGTKVSIKLVATVISKTRLFDPTGDPIYNVNYESVFKSFSTPEDKQKFLKLKAEYNLPKPITVQPPKAP